MACHVRLGDGRVRDVVQVSTELVRRWVDALRSGDYCQGKGALRRQLADGTCVWCCLGVLADVADPTRWRGPESWTADFSYGSSDHIGSLHKWTWETWVGDEGDVTQMYLTVLNDGSPDATPRSFNEIADLLEAVYLTS